MTCLTGASENDEIFYWDTVRFSVQGCIFKVPKYHFIQGSDYFSAKYLSFREGGDVVEPPAALEDVTAVEFRTFLKVLFPIHKTSTTTTLTKPEWITILTLSTRWRFNHLRKLAIGHLEPLLQSDPIERIQIGRAVFVPSWVLSGYEELVTRSKAISEEESGMIGHLSTVRLYIIRHDLQSDGHRPFGRGGKGFLFVISARLRKKFDDELEILKVQEADRCPKEEIEEEQRVDVERTKQEEERAMWAVDEELKRKMEEEEVGRVHAERVQMEEEERKWQERRLQEEEERRLNEKEERRWMLQDERRLREEQEEKRLQEEEERRWMLQEERRIEEEAEALMREAEWIEEERKRQEARK